MMVSAPLQYKVKLPSGLLTGNKSESQLTKRVIMHHIKTYQGLAVIIIVTDYMNKIERIGNRNMHFVIS